ncbi:MAG: VanZ family protein [Luteimonas sp.]|nr:VanZ family protein [Luteimonas sp.]
MTRYRPGRSLKPFRHPWLWCGFWCLGIAALVALSLMPGPPMPDFEGSDKVGHLLAYFLLAAGAVQLFARWSSLFGAGLALVLLGIGLEYAQGAFTDYRVLDARDALANTLGVIAGLGTQLTPLRDLLLRLDRGWDQS